MLIEKYDLQVLTPPCEPGAERFTAKARLVADIREVLPYLNATLRGAVYFPDSGAEYSAPALTWKKAGHNVAFHPYEIAVSNAVDRDERAKGTRRADRAGQPHVGAARGDHAVATRCAAARR